MKSNQISFLDRLDFLFPCVCGGRGWGELVISPPRVFRSVKEFDLIVAVDCLGTSPRGDEITINRV